MNDEYINSMGYAQLVDLRDRLEKVFMHRDRFVNLQVYKSFYIKSYCDDISRISFLVGEDNSVGGIDYRGNLFVGRLGPFSKIILFKFNPIKVEVQCFNGTLDINNMYLQGQWYPTSYTDKFLKEINSWNNFSRLYMLPNENIPNIDILIESAYDSVINSPWISGRDKDLICSLKGISRHYKVLK